MPRDFPLHREPPPAWNRAEAYVPDLYASLRDGAQGGQRHPSLTATLFGMSGGDLFLCCLAAGFIGFALAAGSL